MTEKEPLVTPGIEYERNDINPKWLALSAVLILLLTVGAMILMIFYVNGLETRRAEAEPTPLPMLQARPTPPSPRLQPNPIDNTTGQEDLATLRRHEEQILNSYGWIDEEAGVVRIPIDQAIELLSAGDGEEEPQR